MEIYTLSHLLLLGNKSIGEIATTLGISNTYASILISKLEKEKIVIKKREGKKIIVSPNKESPFIKNLSKFVILAGIYPPFTPVDFLTPDSRRRVLWQLRNESKMISELKKITGYSRTTIYDALRPFIRIGMISAGKGKIKNYCVDYNSPLARPLFQLLEFTESEMEQRPLLDKLSSDERVIALGVFGSQILGKKDIISDIDVLVVVNSPGDRVLVEDYQDPKIQFNIYSRQGIVHLIRREPWFLTLMLDGKILKGEDFLKDLDEINLEVDPEEIIDEINMMLKDVDKIPAKERANVMIYCIRTALAMKLYYDERLDQKTLVDELLNRYPEFEYYRDIKRKGRATKTVIEKTIEKVMEDLMYVQKAQEKGS